MYLPITHTVSKPAFTSSCVRTLGEDTFNVQEQNQHGIINRFNSTTVISASTYCCCSKWPVIGCWSTVNFLLKKN